jgi:hypothetical protein
MYLNSASRNGWRKIHESVSSEPSCGVMDAFASWDEFSFQTEIDLKRKAA